MKATFLLGSGISIPAGLPSVGKITNAILSGDGLAIEPDGRVVDEDTLASHWVEEARASMVAEGREKVRRILLLLEWLKIQANSRYAEIEGRSANYEDLAYLAGQISDDLGGEYENPALQAFVRNALIDLAGLFAGAGPSAAREALRKLAADSVDYIRQVVRLQLLAEPSDTSYLQLFADTCKDPRVTEVKFFTLNHDTLLEKSLKENGVTVIDGLREPSNGDGSRRWDSTVFDHPDGGTRASLFKLHGSVDWFLWDPNRNTLGATASSENADRNRRFIGTYKAHDPNRPVYDRLLYSPRLLAGTFNKILEYNSEIFLDLHHRFHHALLNCQTLVVCGYGFGDKGVNTRIAEWRHRPSNPKLLIIDPAEPSKIVLNARGAIQREIAAIDPVTTMDPLSPGVVMHWKNGLSDHRVTWERIRAVLEDC